MEEQKNINRRVESLRTQEIRKEIREEEMKKTVTLRDNKFGFKVEVTVSGKEEVEGDLDNILAEVIDSIICDCHNWVTK